jgi:hypothetical protein
MHNVAPSRALARRTRQLLTIAFVIAALGTFIAVAGLALFVVPIVGPNSPSYGTFTMVRLGVVLFGIVIFFVALGFAVRAMTLRKDNDLAQTVGKFLTSYLDTRYHFIRNISKRGVGYIDAVLIGPPGVLVFRILDERGVYANEGANWLKQEGGPNRWVKAKIDPTRECVEDVKKLREFLALQKLETVPVYGVIVFVREQPQLQLLPREPVVPITTLRALLPSLNSNYLAKERMDAGRIGGVVQLLYDA